MQSPLNHFHWWLHFCLQKPNFRVLNHQSDAAKALFHQFLYQYSERLIFTSIIRSFCLHSAAEITYFRTIYSIPRPKYYSRNILSLDLSYCNAKVEVWSVPCFEINVQHWIFHWCICFRKFLHEYEEDLKLLSIYQDILIANHQMLKVAYLNLCLDPPWIFAYLFSKYYDWNKSRMG